MAQKVKKAVIPVAGLATRFLPQTKAMPKHMLPLVDKPIIQYIVEQLVEAGIEDVIMVTNPYTKTIEDHFNLPPLDLVETLKNGGENKRHLLDEINKIPNLANFIFTRQKGPLGNGTPLLNVKSIVRNEPFIYKWGDDMILSEPNSVSQLVELYNEFGCSILGSIRITKDEDYDKYGIAGGRQIRPGVIDIREMIEKPGKDKAPSNLANLSPFLFTPDIFEYVQLAISNLKPGQEFYYNDVLNLMIKDGKRIIAAEIKHARYLDTGNKIDYLKAVTEFGIKHHLVGREYRNFLKELVKGM